MYNATMSIDVVRKLHVAVNHVFVCPLQILLCEEYSVHHLIVFGHFFQILVAMGMQKTASSALNLLIDIGYFPVHVNLDLLKLNIRTDHPEEVVSAAEELLSASRDIDEVTFVLFMCIILQLKFLPSYLSGHTCPQGQSIK